MARRLKAEALDQRLPVVAVAEGAESFARFQKGVEVARPEHLLPEGRDEPLGDPVDFRLPREGRGRFDPEEADLIVEVIDHEPEAVIVAQLESGGDFGTEPAEVLADALTDRLEGFEARGAPDDVDSAALGRPVVHGGKHGELSVLGRRHGCRIDPGRPLGEIVRGPERSAALSRDSNPSRHRRLKGAPGPWNDVPAAFLHGDLPSPIMNPSVIIEQLSFLLPEDDMVGFSIPLSPKRFRTTSVRSHGHSLRTCLPLTAALAACTLAWAAAPAIAQESPDTVVADTLLVVVGSRAGIQDPVLLPVPVDIYGREELSRLGDIDLREALARVAPSFNSTRLTVGDGAAFHVATLRGMNPDQVLVLVNGKRRHGIAFAKVLSMLGMGTTGTDLRAIPISAIERIEVLREGAASQYGSDAIAGLINIVLKDDAAGSAWSTYLGRTSFGDGERLLTSGNVGFALGDRGGFLNVTGEYSRQTPSQRGGEAPTCFGPDPAYAPCADGGKVRLLSRNGDPDYEGGGVMANAALPVGERVELFAFGGYSRRSAVSDGLYRKADWVPRNVSYVYPDGFFPLEESDLTDASAVAGIRGELDDWSVELSAGFGQGDFSFDVANSINPSYAAAQLTRNPSATSAEIAASAGPQSAHSGALNLRQMNVNADAQRDIVLGSAPGSLAVGAALRNESYRMEAGDLVSYACGPGNTAGSFPAAHHLNADGSQIASCGMQGYPGYSPQSAAESERDRISLGAYVDSEIKPMDEALTLGGALRFEDYTDAGSSLTARLASRLQLGQSGAAVRAAVSTGFRAPSLPQRGFNTLGFVGSSGGLQTNGFLPEGDPIACADFGACSLGHETSFSLTGGFVYAHESGLRLTADYYRVAVKDAIALTEGLSAEHGLRANAQFQGRPVEAVAFWTNAIDTRTQGFDIVGSWRFRGMNWGAADLSASLHRNETVITANRNPYFIRETQTMLITEAQPRTRMALSGDVRWASGFGARVRMRHLGAVMVPTVFEAPTEIEGAAIADAEVTFTIDGRVRIGLGANNLFDKLPKQLAADHVAQLWALDYAPESPYGIAGRITYVRVDVFGN